MNIRLAVPEDADRIAQVHIASWRETYHGIIPTMYLKHLSHDKREQVWRKVRSSLRLITQTKSSDLRTVDQAGGAKGRKESCTRSIF